MLTRILLIAMIAGMVMIGTGGCSSPSHPGALAPTSTPALHPSLTPPLPRAPRVGDVAPDFALDNLDGTRTVHLSDFPGKSVLLFFWATTCSSCVKELPIIQKFSVGQQAASKQMVVLGVDLDQVSVYVNIAALRQRLGLTYLILVDDHFQAQSSYQIKDVPLAYFLDRQHVIRSIVAEPLDDTILHKEVSNIV